MESTGGNELTIAGTVVVNVSRVFHITVQVLDWRLDAVSASRLSMALHITLTGSIATGS
jgi:hypothetical protein